jgi:hypothetical protein
MGGKAAIATRPRRFTLADAMVLVAATAVGLALARAFSGMVFPTSSSFLYGGAVPGPLPGLAPLSRRIVLGWPVVAMATLALVGLRLRRPRPPGRRLFAPPGVSACMVAAAVMALEALSTASLSIPGFFKAPLPGTLAGLLEDGRVRQMWWTVHATVADSVSYAVIAWWLAMALARRWRPERSWIDRAGRAVGLLWIALPLLRLHIRMNCLDV